MSKSIRVYLLARELDMKSKEVLKVLQEDMNLDITNHMSTVNTQVANRVREIVKHRRQGKEIPEPEETAQAEAAEEEAGGEEEQEQQEQPEEPPAEPEPEPEQAEQAEQRVEVAEKEEQRSQQTDSRTSSATQSRRQRSRPQRETITLSGAVAVGDLADMMGIRPTVAIQRLINMGIMASINQEIDTDVAQLLAKEFGVDIVVEEADEAPTVLDLIEEPTETGDLVERAPVVTVLGHVDHGKTTLLDTIRQTDVTRGEAGGITQHIGASSVEHEGRRIVFLDTPGHEAFTAMRARGAQATDIVILVVAADDGIMPQTVEAINHAKQAGVPIVVAVNKIDLPEANPDRVKQQLTEYELIPEEWGGDTVVVEVSALHGDGLDELLEVLALLAEIEELKADPSGPARGTVIEAEIDKGRGPVATVLIEGGTLERGDAFVAGIHAGKVRAMTDERGERVNEAGPSTPVEIMGLSDVPLAGDPFVVVSDESQARELAEQLQEEYRERELAANQAVSLDAFYQQAQDMDERELRLIIKADVQGTLEATRGALEKLSTDEVGVSVIHGGVGAVNESDVMLASASDAIIIGFNVRPDANARREAERTNVEIRTYRVIYDAIEDVRKALEGLLEPDIQEVIVGRAEVRATFSVPGAGTVAGLYVTEGKLTRNVQIRLIRDGVVVHEGPVASLKRFEDDVREVQAGYECGLGIENFTDIKEGDEIEAFTEKEVKRTLE
jgi:translation initiation factor IF-2